MPTGSTTYNMIGATAPSCSPNCSATLNSSSLSVNFDSRTASMIASFTVNGFDNYSGSIPLTITGSTFGGNGSIAGGCCGASLLAKGFFAGDAAARAGLSYHLGTGMAQDVNGAVAYKNAGAAF